MRRTVAAQAAVLALVLVAGVARVVTYQPDTASLRELGTIVAAVRAESTVRVALVITARSGRLSQETTGEGAVDFAHGLSSLTIDGGIDGDRTVIFDRTTVWAKVPRGKVAFNGGHHWVAFAGNWRQPRPEDSLDTLAALTGRTPRARGHTDIGGLRTTRYVVRMTLRDLVAQLGDRARALFAAAAESLGDGTAVLAVYVDETGLLRRFTIAIRVGRVSVDVRYDYYDYGRPVGIAPPPAGDVVTAKTLAEMENRLGTARP